ncbi:MAG: segregation/condensation protein A [Candidatus Aminicenantes bacterium]|nr:segregation/condensation protein A [Candidatus Aminicenantes bacterium]
MESAETYQVNLEVFQGPLDLLLFLIRKQKIDIHDIPVATITQEYLQYLEQKEKINLDREAEFLLMAALLIYIKSQMLLPREATLEEEEDPRQSLVHRLLDYQKMKAASTLLRKKEAEELLKWKRTFLPPFLETEDLDLIEVSLFDLAEAFFTVMKKKERGDFQVIKRKEYSVEEKTEEILAILRENSYLDFLDFFARQVTLEEALVSFFSLLELIKARRVIAVQEKLFQSIKVWITKDPATGQN